MAKANNKLTNHDKSPSSGPKTYCKKKQQQVDHDNNNKNTNPNNANAKISALDEIDTLFADKKQSAKSAARQLEHQKHIDNLQRQRRKEARMEEEADTLALRGVTSAASSIRGEKSLAPKSLHAKAIKLSSLSYTRSDLNALNKSNDNSNEEQKQKWASDGLGGVFNGEGYTGRKDESGHRVFKAHLMNKEGFGKSADCPFDCDCCYI